ncbi:MAG: hypothetical protein IJS06_06250 [Prevotella sp.]|nr:hypothetical protein [Prevotella sp.]
MANSNGVITAPIGLVDVQQVLGESSTDLATLCLSNNINMWAKYKPVVLGTVGHNDANWWKGTFGNCGIRMVGIRTTNRANIPSLYSSEDNGWQYEKPYGGSNSPYRLADFEGYNHYAIPPVSNFGGTTTVFKGGTCSFSIGYNAGGNSSLALTDITALGTDFADMYFGVLVKGRETLCLTASSALGDGGSYVSFNSSNLSGESYMIYPFLAVSPITIGSAESINEYYSLPIISPVRMDVYTSEISFISTTSYSNGMLTMRIRIKNLTTSSYTISKLVAVAQNESYTPSPSSIGDVSQIVFDTPMSIPAQETYSTTVRLRGWSCENQEGKMYCYAWLKHNGETEDTLPLEVVDVD